MNHLIIIHSTNPELLTPFRSKATHWLVFTECNNPELNNPVPDKASQPKYEPPEIICTTRDDMIPLITELFKAGQLDPNQFIYIDIEAPTIVISYTYDSSGNVTTFQRLETPLI